VKPESRRRAFALLALAAGGLVAAVVWWLPGSRGPVWSTAPVPFVYVGGAKCTRCHEDEARLWQGSQHAHAMQEATEDTVLGDFDDVRFRHDGVVTRFYRRKGGFFVRTEGPDGRPAEYPVPFVFGVYPLQQYLIPLPGGRYQAFSVAWDSRPRKEGGQRWFHLYPAEHIGHEDVLHWTKLSQNWNTQCAECHSTNLLKNYRWPEDRFGTTWSEIDVSCEACHGPGSRHLAWAQAAEARGRKPEGDPGLQVRFTERRSRHWKMDLERGIARPVSAPAFRTEVETCARCHARRGVLTEDWRPGRLLADTHRPALLEEGLYYADGQMRDEVYNWGSFLQSRMYAAGITCSDCHDAHSGKVRVSADDVCSSCHQPERFATPQHHFHRPRSKGASCVACHMRTATYMVVDPRHDHSLRVPRPDLTLSLGTPNACNDCHRDRSAAWAAHAVRKWYPSGRWTRPHYGAVLQAGRRREAGAGEALAALAADGTQPGIVRGTAVSLLSGVPGRAAASALEKAAVDADPLVRLGAASALDSLEPRERLRIGGRLLGDAVLAVRVEAVVPLADVPVDAMTEGQRVAFDRALDDFFQAQRANAERPEAHVNLGVLYVKRGRLEAARRAYDAALRVGPWFLPAYANLADLLRNEGRDDEGEKVLRAGLGVDATNAALHYALGLLLVRQKRPAEALEELARADALAPDDARVAYVYAVALHSSGQTDRALAVLRRAHERSTGDVDVLVALVTLNRERGALGAARRWARTLLQVAPGSEAAQRLAAELGDPGG
jgi:tetratricopeptide (TPR) repeat protein